VVRGNPAGDDVEAVVGERQVLRAAEHVGAHPGRRVAGDDGAAGRAQSGRDVAAAARDVQHGLAGGPLREQLEVAAAAVRLALAVGLGALAPDIHHAASSTARRAASSIVASTCRFGGAASLSSARPSSALVPSKRTTIGCSIVICESACRIPCATTSQRVMPAKMLKTIERTCGSTLITSSASTTPCASPPPPRSQKFAGLPPTSAITSSVDITSPAPLPRIPTSPSSLTYVTPFSRAARSSGGYASRSRISAMSGCLSSALSSTVNFESSARTSPSGVTISGLISQSMASDSTKQR